MDAQVNCPGCQAQLMLPPVPAGQTVQCPRCQHVFEPAARRAQAPIAVHPVEVEDEPFELPREIDHPLPLRGRIAGTLLSCMIGVYCLFFLAQAWHYVDIAGTITDLLGKQPPFVAVNLEQRLLDLEENVDNLYAWASATFWATGICYLVWIYRISSNLQRLKTTGVRNSPGGTVWMHFIPIGNLVLPYLALQEIWRASDPERVDSPRSWQTAPPSNLIRAWYAGVFLCWLLSFTASTWYSHHRVFIRRFVGAQGDTEGLQDERTSACFFIACHLGAIITGILFILIVRGITHRQRDRHDEVYHG